VRSVVVVGGGAVGLCVAESFASRSVSVTTLERDRCGLGASAGNAGWITPSHGIPVPGPGVIGQSLRWLVDPSGPLWIRPTVSPTMLAWISRFVVSCRRSSYRHGLAALQTATARAPASFDRLAERDIEFEFHSHDLLYPAFSDGELEHLLGVAADVRASGSSARIGQIGRAEMLALEPALSDRLVGGLIAEDERRVRPESFVAGMKRAAEGVGVEVIERAPVTALRRYGSEWVASGPSGEWRADTVILANGVPAANLVRQLGVDLPLAAAKGYSRTFARAPSGPSRPVYLETPKVAISVYDGGVRVSGTLELGAQTLSLSTRRLRAITTAAREALPDWEMPSGAVDWAGMRSLSPDGLPYIGAVPGLDGLYVATGHATLGMTLAPLSGELLCDRILDHGTDRLLAAFDPARAVRRHTYRPRQEEGHERRERSDRHPLRLGSDG
jgi:D-amino-acid dehydrogenase